MDLSGHPGISHRLARPMGESDDENHSGADQVKLPRAHSIWLSVSAPRFPGRSKSSPKTRNAYPRLLMRMCRRSVTELG